MYLATTMKLYPTRLRMQEDPFKHLRNILSLWGQRDEYLLICSIILAIKWLGFISRSVFIFQSLKNSEVLLEISATYPIPLLAVTKMSFLFFNRKPLKFLYTTVTEKFWYTNIAGLRLHNFLQKRYKFVNVFLLSHTLTSTFYVVLHLLFAKVPIPEGRSRWLPMLISLPFNQDSSPLYEILYAILTWNMFLSALGNGLFDFLFVYGIQHLWGQFVLLSETVKKLDYKLMKNSNDSEKIKSKRFQKKIFKRVVTCIRHHTLLIKYGNELRNFSSSIFGLQLITTLLTLVLVGFIFTENFEELTKSAMLLSLIFSSTLQFVIFAVLSAELYHTSCSLAEAVYQSNWHLFNAKTKQSLTLLIMNSQKGISMYGAGLVKINNELIVQMGQKVFSFITLLRSLAE